MKVARLGHRAVLLGSILGTAPFWRENGERVLDARVHHLGDDRTPEWTEAPPEPEGSRLELEFEARALPGEACLSFHARSVGSRWDLALNGRPVVELDRHDAPRRQIHPLPAGVLRDGTNRLELSPSDPADDITFGDLRLIEATLREVLDLVPVHVRVVDETSGEGLPARITISDPQGEAIEVRYAQSTSTAVRPGVVYAGPGGARMEVPAGARVFWASRGPEWSRAVERVELTTGLELELRLSREVDTRGWIATDTHLHTLTFSGHGDSSVEERILTLAGEGVELAVATDHNHNTDYRPWQQELGLEGWFTPVVGNEVTTPVGHFNAFPLDPSDEVPAFDGTDYVKIVAGIRERGARVVILNHPRWPDHERGPFGVAGLDPWTGARAEPMPVVFDATELVNSCTREPDPMQLFRDWFCLLNRGERVVAVGSSDSHTVGEPVGQGRTYVASSSDDPALVDVEEAAANIAAGRSSISMGIFVEVAIDGVHSAGEIAPLVDSGFDLGLRVASPSWVQPDSLRVFVNGIETLSRSLDMPAAGRADGGASGFDAFVEARIPWPHPHDAWVVCVVSGPQAGDPFWPMTNDYTLAATNPIYLDADADGRYSPPRESARRVLERAREQGTQLAATLATADQAVGVHVLDLARLAGLEDLHRELAGAAGAAGSGPWIQEWLATWPASR